MRINKKLKLAIVGYGFVGKATDQGFNKYVTNGITAAIPINSNKAWMIEKKIIVAKEIFSLLSKNFQKLRKIFINNLV